jgi:hypothetical protein
MIAYVCALQEREKSGIPSGDFFGVPVFQVLYTTMINYVLGPVF